MGYRLSGLYPWDHLGKWVAISSTTDLPDPGTNPCLPALAL